MKRIVITGASSFVGAHLAHEFSQEWEVLATASRTLEAYDPIKKSRLEYATSRATLATLDVTEMAQVEALLQNFKPNYWIHHAGFASNYASMDFDLRKSLDINLHNLKDLYRLFAKHELEGVLVTGSSMEYGNSDKPFAESDPCYPVTPYGLSKLNTTLYTLALSREYKLPTAVCRVFIPYGRLDNPGKLIPSFIESIRHKNSIELTDCTQRRDFLSVREIVRAYRAAIPQLTMSNSGVYNVCAGHSIPLKEFLEIILRKFGGDPVLARFGAKPMRSFESSFNGGANEKFQRTFAHTINSDIHLGIDELLKL